MVSINAISVLLFLLLCTTTRGFVRNIPSSWRICAESCKEFIDRSPPKIVLLKNARLNKLPQLWMAKGDVDTNPFYKGQDAYQILQVPRGADKKDIKTGYRKAVSTWHPDKFPDDDKKKAEGNLRMEKINRAWYCLGDDDRKRRYDQFGEQGVGSSASSEEQIKAAGSPMGSSGFGGSGGRGGAVDVNDISDIFDSFFGGFSQGSQQPRKKANNVNAPVAGTHFF
jgi:DnaJ domain